MRMIKDITPELLEKIETDFKARINSNSEVRSLFAKIKTDKATYKDAQRFAVKVSEIMSEFLNKHLSSAVLPDGKMYYNIADRIFNQTLGKNGTYGYISKYAQQVQDIINKNAGIGIKAVTAELNQDRIKGIVDIVSGKDNFDDIKYMINEPVVNFGQAIVDDTVKANADFQFNSGLSPKIVRISEGGCCEWCDKIAGVYDYENVRNTGNDVFRRHKYCRCLVTYEAGGKRPENVHTKKKLTNEELEQRKTIGLETPLKKNPDDVIKKVKKSAAKTSKNIENTGESGKIVADKIISGHSNTPKQSEPNTVIDHIDKNGSVDARGFYGDDGMKEKDIHTTNHGNPKTHPYGNNGEHGHDYDWDEDGKLKNKTRRELTEKERKDNGDIL